MDFIAIDFETANQERDSACELGICIVKNNEIIETKSWLIRPPELYFDSYNVHIHGITEDDVRDKPKFKKLWQEIKPYFEGNNIVAHFASFDISVLRHTFDTYSIPYPEFNYLCSYIVSKKVWQGLLSYDLKSLCQLNRIELEHHRALPDAIACANLFLKAFEQIGKVSLEGVENELDIKIGKLFPNGYLPCRVKPKDSRDLSKIIGDPNKHKPEHLFYGKTVVFTGTLTSMVRSKAQQIVVDIGGINATTVTKTTDFLIVGQQDFKIVGEDGMSNKQEKALKLLQKGNRIEVISEDDFLRLIE